MLRIQITLIYHTIGSSFHINKARTIRSNVSISLPLVAFDGGADIGEIPFGCFALIASFLTFTLEVYLT